MSTNINQKAYLQKYLGGPSTDKKKKKKVAKGKGFKIIDDDIDLTKLRPLDIDEIDLLDQGEDGPQIAGIIDERPEEVKKLEQFKTSSKWRVITEDDGFNSKLQIEEIKKDVKEAQKENELIFGKMYSDSEDEKEKNSDLSPPRIKPNEHSNNRESKKKQQNNSDSDFSPPRRGREPSLSRKDNRNYDSDLSPPRKRDISKSKTKIRKPSRWGDSSPDHLYLRRSESPVERSKQNYIKKRKKSNTSDSDLSPPRKSQKEKPYRSRSPRKSGKPDSGRHFSPNSVISTNTRHQMPKKSYERYKRENIHNRKSDDSDLSPPRKNRRSESPPKRGNRLSPEKRKKRHRDSSSDLSPPRKSKNVVRNHKKNDDSPPPTNKKMERTLDGKKAGLQDARQLREENDAFKKREDDAFKNMTDEVSGRNAQVVSRKVNKRDTSEERRKLKEKAERQKELDEKYKKWSKGLKQIEAQEARMQDYMHEASKPLARHKNDKDLESTLKEIQRDGDPMLQYIRNKKRERGELGPEKPMYKGNFPPNRFNIRPGYRWDGVDRSNGYEKKFFEQQSKRKAQEEEAYKWSTEDL